MSALGLTAVDVFVIVLGLWFGYSLVSHLLRRSGPTGDAAEDGQGFPGGAGEQRESRREDAQTPAWESILGVSRQASPDEIRRAYREQMAKYHPDKVASLGDELKALAERRSKEINVAYAAACREKGFQ